MPYANNKGADQPAHPHSLISAFVIRCLDSKVPLLAIAKISIPQLFSSAEQAGLSLNWLKTPKTGFLVMWLKFIHGWNIVHIILWYYCFAVMSVIWLFKHIHV